MAAQRMRTFEWPTPAPDPRDDLPQDMADELELVVRGARETMARLYGTRPDDLDDMCGSAREVLCRLARKLRQLHGDDRLRMARKIVNDAMRDYRRSERRRSGYVVSLSGEHLETFVAGVDEWRLV